MVKFTATADGTAETVRSFAMPSAEVPGGAWTHVAVTRRGGTLKLWARVAGGGAQKSSSHGFAGTIWVSTVPVKIGRGFAGMIDEARLSTVSREGQFCQVRFRYRHNSANQLLTERIGTPDFGGSFSALSVDNATSGATECRYAYDPDGNNVAITEYARTGVVNGATGVKVVGETMTYDALGRQTKWQGYTAAEHTSYQGDGWKRAETIAPGAGPRQGKRIKKCRINRG